MKVLSIRQPWATLIVLGAKDLENRTWYTPYRGPILIHAGKALDEECFSPHGELLTHLFPVPLSADVPRHASEYLRGGIVGRAMLTGVVTQSLAKSPWFEGPYGFVLHEASPLPFVESRGQLGLFDAPEAVIQSLRSKMKEKR